MEVLHEPERVRPHDGAGDDEARDGGHLHTTQQRHHSDRRCEDPSPDYVNGSLPILAIEQEGVLQALVMSYAIHGTVLNIDELTLSQDVSGGIEQAVEDLNEAFSQGLVPDPMDNIRYYNVKLMKEIDLR